MEIFGFRDRAHREYAENLGVFLQIVNIVRDIREDQHLGRLYLPSEDFKRFHLHPDHLEERNSHWAPFIHFQLDRAWSFLEKSRKALSRRQRAALPTAEAIAAVYVRLFHDLKRHPSKILRGKHSLSKSSKLIAAASAALRCLWWKGTQA